MSNGLSSSAIKRLLLVAIGDLYRNDPTIDDFSSETGQTEWNLAAHLAPEIAKYFEGYCFDVDVRKVNLENRRPDIIIHKRGATTSHNLLVIEVKRERPASEVLEDARKIQEYWFGERLRYQFGATINLRADHSADIEVFSNKQAVGLAI